MGWEVGAIQAGSFSKTTKPSCGDDKHWANLSPRLLGSQVPFTHILILLGLDLMAARWPEGGRSRGVS